jgi:hypothetical protein
LFPIWESWNSYGEKETTENNYFYFLERKFLIFKMEKYCSLLALNENGEHPSQYDI